MIETREYGLVKWSTYQAYLDAIGPQMIAVLVMTIGGIMVMQQLVSLWVTYWVDDNKTKNFMYPYVTATANPTSNAAYLGWYAGLVLVFTIFNFAGHISEIVGGVG